MEKKLNRKVRVGSLFIGGGSPIVVQSMTKTDTHNIPATVKQIRQLENAGCELVRVAVPDIDSAKNLKKIKKQIKIPLVADIHFNYKLALEAINQGVDKIRINPGNIGTKEKVKQIVKSAKLAKIPIRIGINAGSLALGDGLDLINLKNKMGRENSKRSMSGMLCQPSQVRPLVMVKTALNYVKMFESWNFYDIVISLKASDVLTTIESYRLLAKKVNYPLHLGVTESGPPGTGTVKSSLGIGILLNEGIGDTVRVSLTSSPVEEVKVAYQILQGLKIRFHSIDIISCPTCSRCQVNLVKIVNELEKKLADVRYACKKHIKVAIMGCIVNGPGEAKEADVGIAGGKNTGLLFKHGKPIRKVKPSDWVKTLLQEIS